MDSHDICIFHSLVTDM